MARPAPMLLIGGSLALLMTSAAYLYLMRGPALLIDLAATGRALFCF